MPEKKPKAEFTKRWSTDPIWRCGVLEIRDVKKDGGQWARNGYDDTARYNLWVGHEVFPVNVSPTLTDLKRWALENYDPATGAKKEK